MIAGACDGLLLQSFATSVTPCALHLVPTSGILTRRRRPYHQIDMTQGLIPGDDWDKHWSDYNASVERNPAQAMRRRIIHSLLRVGDEAARILDIGCGQGELLAEMKARYPQAELRGMDSSQGGLDIAARRVPDATFVRRDLLMPASPPSAHVAWATHAVCSEVLEHVDHPESLLGQARQYLAPGCRLVVTVPGGPMSAFDHHIGHRQHFTAESLRDLLRAAGFRVEKATGVGFPHFNVYRLAVVARGGRLVNDVAHEAAGAPVSTQARLAMKGFGLLLSLPQLHTRFGWQMVAVARV